MKKSFLFIFGFTFLMFSCEDKNADADSAVTENTVTEAVADTLYPSEVIGFFDKFKLILGSGKNVGFPVDYIHEDFFYTTTEDSTNWIVYKTPNGGSTHGSSNNTRTELAQAKKWLPQTPAKLTATCKVMHVSKTGDPRVAATHSVVVGQIHSADGHENEPLKIFYKKFPDHTKGSVFWNYEINTAGDDNGGRWDFSTAVWGHDMAVIGSDENTSPPEPEDGIELGEEFSYDIEVKDGIMTVKFMSEGHETKSFTKNIIVSEYTKKSDMPEQARKLFAAIGQDGVERPEAYTGEGLFFKQGCYNQTNGKAPETNMVWCSGAETHGGDIQKQYETGNYAEVWFKESEVTVSEDAISNEGYFEKNDFYKKK